jgi:hypothetical protein
MSDTNDEREAFEAHLRSQGIEVTANWKGYLYADTASAWRSWQACAARKDAEIADLRKVAACWQDYAYERERRVATLDAEIAELKAQRELDHIECANCGHYFRCERCDGNEPEIHWKAKATGAGQP